MFQQSEQCLGKYHMEEEATVVPEDYFKHVFSCFASATVQ